MKHFFPRRNSIAAFLGIFLLFLAGTCLTARAANSLVINLMVVNGSSTTKEFPVRYALPEEVDPEGVINSGGLSIDYDVGQGTYYLYGAVILGPKESKIFKVEVKDIWQITPEEVSVLKQQLTDNLELLNNTRSYEGAKLIRDQMAAQLDYILAQQDRYANNIDLRIEQYESHQGILNNIRNHAFSPGYLRKQSEVSDLQGDQTLRIVIEVLNSKDQPAWILHQHYLPAELTPADIVDAQGFEVRYDEKKQQRYLAKDETLGPGERKRYEIVVKDIWALPQATIDKLQSRAALIRGELKGTPYEDSARFLFSSIETTLQVVQESQGDRNDVTKYIGAFRANQKRLEQVKMDIGKLEDMLSAVSSKRLDELSDGVGTLQRLRALKGVSTISVAVFGAKPSLTMTWRIIMGIVVFLAFFTGIHFFTWWRRSGVMGEGTGVKPGEPFKRVLENDEEQKEEEGL